MINKCPYCGSNKFGKIETGKDNVKYVLTQIDLSSNSFLAKGMYMNNTKFILIT